MPERGLDARYSFALPEGLSCEVGLDGVVTRVNGGVAAILGQEPEAVLGHRLTDFIHTDDHAAIFAAFARLASGGDAVTLENRCYCEDGSYVWLVWLMTRPGPAGPIYAAARGLTSRAAAGGGVVARERRIRRRVRRLERENDLLRDQTEELAAHRNALQRVLELNHALLDASIDGIRLVDLDGRTILANSVIEELTTDVFGLPRDATFPERSSIAPRLEDPERYLATMEAIAADPAAETEDVFEVSDLGRVFQRHTRPVRDSSGALIGRIVIVREITAARVAEREAADLKAAERLKSELVATVSHELRTPLTSVLGFVHLLMDEDLAADERARYLETVNREALRLAALIDDVLDLRKIDAGQFALAIETFDLSEMLRAEAELFEQQSESHTLQLDAPERLSFTGDRKRLRQLVGNLLSNAIKYSPEGGVVELAATSVSGGIQISVRDRGIGIAPDQQARVFTEFFRVDSKAMREIGGTGLGLSLCQEIAQAHGGRIRVESAVGQGATFIVELPHAEERAEAA
jgi:signal transduction histidine kinase